MFEILSNIRTHQCSVHFVKSVVTGISLVSFVRKFKTCGFAVISRCYCVSVCKYCVLNICNNTCVTLTEVFRDFPQF
jgi:hypothetical protein